MMVRGDKNSERGTKKRRGIRFSVRSCPTLQQPSPLLYQSRHQITILKKSRLSSAFNSLLIIHTLILPRNNNEGSAHASRPLVPPPQNTSQQRQRPVRESYNSPKNSIGLYFNANRSCTANILPDVDPFYKKGTGREKPQDPACSAATHP
jgi:hypothetical protein